VGPNVEREESQQAESEQDGRATSTEEGEMNVYDLQTGPSAFGDALTVLVWLPDGSTAPIDHLELDDDVAVIVTEGRPAV
jgi:hypothetical protein